MTQLPTDVTSLLNQLSLQLNRYIIDQKITNPLIIGIHTGGVWVAESLCKSINIAHTNASLNITFYRDDFSHIGFHPTVKPSNLPADIDDKNIILVDDVLYTGRTIRAALNEIFDYGRPASIHLAVLIERNGRELPIQADVSGCKIDLENHQHIKIKGPDPLSVSIVENKH